MYNGALYTLQDCPYTALSNIPAQKRGPGNPRSRKNKWNYKDCICAFDIETTNIPEIQQSVMYIWQFAIEGIGVITGRTWNEFLQFLDKLRGTMMPNEKYLIFVHNLSFEFQYLKGIYAFRPEEVFAISPRKVLKCSMYDQFEFRCSYLQCNMSLDSFTRAMGVEFEKLSGFDYDKQRWFDTQLSDFELAYCVHDVAGLVQAMRKRIDYAGDNFYTVPMTSTGYCRRDARNVFQNVPRRIIKDQLPDFRTYTYLRRAFRGGNTHASRFYANVKLTDVKSVDRSSSYPDVLINHKYPVTKLFELSDPTYRDMLNLIDIRERAVLAEVEFIDLKLKDRHGCGCPYLSLAKCEYSYDRVNDNGRILSASWVQTVITDVDFRIIRDQYIWKEIRVNVLFHARYGYLPGSFRELIKEYYRNKTSLKGIEGREEDYRHSKELINALYGMSAQDPCKRSLIYEDDDFIEDMSTPGEEILDHYYRRAFMPYTYGVWCTAWARWELQQMIDLCGNQFVYTDTDSVKYVGNVDFYEYNARCIKNSMRSGAYAYDPKGHIHYMGVAEYEGCYSEFKTLGAKKYVARDASGKLGITIAGVSKKLGGIELENAGGVDAFKEGFTFYEAGGLEAVYNDKPNVPYFIRSDGTPIPLTSNLYLGPSTYTLGLTAEYRRILELQFLDIPVL